MHVIEYRAQNIKRIKDIDFKMEGRNLFLVGGANGSGKTSSIESLLSVLCGRSGMDYPEPLLRDGEDEGWVSVKLSGDHPTMPDDDHFTCQLELTRNPRSGVVKESFRIIDSKGDAAPSPRQWIKDLYENKGFDPLVFDRMSKMDRRKTALKLVGLDLDGFETERSDLYDKRKLANSQVKQQEGKVDAMPSFDDAPDKEINVGQVADELEATRESNRTIIEAEGVHKALVELSNEASAEVDRLEAELKTATVKMKARAKELVKSNKALKVLGEKKSTEELVAKLKESGDTNTKVRANQSKTTEKDVLTLLQGSADKLTKAIATLDKSQDKALKGAEWPVDGMSCDSAGILLDDRPYENASKSQRVIASTKIGMALHPDLKLLVCFDGSDLDTHTIKELDKVLKESGFQMLIEIVTRSQADEDLCAVVIRDGQAKKPEAELVEAS